MYRYQNLFLIIPLFLSLFSCEKKCAISISEFTPVYDLESNTFHGYTGGKYPDGKNLIPNNHFIYGQQLVDSIFPINAEGIMDSTSGKIGMLILGYSTAAMTGNFLQWLLTIQPVNEKLVISIGAQGGKDINAMIGENTSYWTSVNQLLSEDSITHLQVQYIWISTGDLLAYQKDFPEQSTMFADKLLQVLQIIKAEFPNIKIVFVSDRTYAGYIDNSGPKQLKEPTAYYSSWGVKFLIERQINNQPGYTYSDIPFIDWGPTLWTNGSAGNNEGYTWLCEDADKGGIHPSARGRAKEAMRLLTFFTHHPFTKGIFTSQQNQEN